MHTVLKKAVLFAVLAVSASGIVFAAETDADKGPSNLLTAAVAWKQTAAEYRALYYQGYNIARMHVDAALKNRVAGGKPLAIISDVDDTILGAPKYWGHLVANGLDFFDDPIWDEGVADNMFTPMPGAVEFLNYCRDNGVEVFYVTSRDQGETTYGLATMNLREAGFPFVDEKHLIVQRETSNKETAQQNIMEDYDVVVMLGDNLNDFQRKYYVKDVDERFRLMEEDKACYGTKFVVFPNPTDGHWMNAIFGNSEPPASKENREMFEKAATRSTLGK
jgi:5'-nucleotidase (lipoprotein e(P4) family)